MLDGSKRVIAVMTAAACLGAGGWALADSVGGSGTSPSSGDAPSRTIQTDSTTPAVPSGGRPCDHSGPSGRGGDGPGGSSGYGAPAPSPDTSTYQGSPSTPT